jgi:hypothetical protein
MPSVDEVEGVVDVEQWKGTERGKTFVEAKKLIVSNPNY